MVVIDFVLNDLSVWLDVVLCCSDLLRLDSTNADAVYVRGICLYYQDNIDKAFQHFQQVLRLAPDHSKARDTYKVSAKVLCDAVVKII